MKARKLPSGNWRTRVTWTENGKRNSESFTAPTECESLYLAIQFEKNKKRELKCDFTVGEAIDQYIADRSAILSPTTMRTYKQQRNSYFQGIMNIKIDKLTNKQVQTAINREAATLSPKTVKNAYSLLASALAVYGFNINATLPKEVKTEMNIPTEENILALMREVSGTYLEVVFLIAANTGMRRSEICALTWNDIGDSSITINKAKVLDDNKKWVIKPPKSYAGTRTIDVSPAVIARIRSMPRNGNEVIPVLPDTISKRFDALKRKHNLNFRFHDFRHYNASFMLALGIPDKYAMERLGQATTNVLKNVYQHLREDRKTEASKLLNDRLESVLNQKLCHETCHDDSQT